MLKKKKQTVYNPDIYNRHRKRRTDKSSTSSNPRLPTVEVERAGPVRVDLLHDTVEVVRGQLVVQRLQNLLQHLGGDVAVPWQTDGKTLM